MPATNTTTTAADLLSAFELGFNTRKGVRGESFVARAQRAGVASRKMTSDLAAATTNWLAMETYWAGSISASVVAKSTSATVITLSA